MDVMWHNFLLALAFGETQSICPVLHNRLIHNLVKSSLHKDKLGIVLELIVETDRFRKKTGRISMVEEKTENDHEESKGARK